MHYFRLLYEQSGNSARHRNDYSVINITKCQLRIMGMLQTTFAP